jgi:hypothetical protein
MIDGMHDVIRINIYMPAIEPVLGFVFLIEPVLFFQVMNQPAAASFISCFSTVADIDKHICLPSYSNLICSLTEFTKSSFSLPDVIMVNASLDFIYASSIEINCALSISLLF